MIQLVIVAPVVALATVAVGGNNTDEEYTSGVPGVPLEVFQGQLKTRATSGSRASTSASVPPFSPLDEVETVYSCAVGIPSKTSE